MKKNGRCSFFKKTLKKVLDIKGQTYNVAGNISSEVPIYMKNAKLTDKDQSDILLIGYPQKVEQFVFFRQVDPKTQKVTN